MIFTADWIEFQSAVFFLKLADRSRFELAIISCKFEYVDIQECYRLVTLRRMNVTEW